MRLIFPYAEALILHIKATVFKIIIIEKELTEEF